MNICKKILPIIPVIISLVFFVPHAFAATPPPTHTTFSGYKGEYFNNRNLIGTPVLTRDDPTIQFDWSVGSPDPIVHTDHFSVRFTKTVNLNSGMYYFNIVGDDGIRVYVDNNLLIDQWHDQPSTYYKVIKNLGNGAHTIKIEYFEEYGGAVVRLSYGLVPIPTAIPSPSPTLIGTFDGYTLYDDGDIPSVPCPVRTSNSSGIYLQKNGKYTDLRWKGFTLATIAPPQGDNNLNSYIAGSAINESSQVVGQYRDGNAPTSSQKHAFVWKNGVLTIIADGFSGHGGSAYDTNDKGYVIGSIGILQGFIWSTHSYAQLGQLPGAPYRAIPTCIDEFNNMTGSALGPLPEFTNHHVHWLPVVPPNDKNPLVPFIGEYFDNQTLDGTPKITRLDSKINFATNGAFDSSLPKDHFSVRWTKTQFMKAEKYSFTLKSDDGIRFWVDNMLLIDDWTNHSMRTYTPDIQVNKGNHTFKVEYFENTDGAVAILNEDYPARNQVSPTITPTPTPTSIPTPTPLVIGAALGNYTKPTGQDCDITIPSQFSTIQMGINAAVNGDTVCVSAGIYNENVRVNKSITLAGYGSDSPSVINPVTPMYNEGAAIKIEADNVTIKGFEITGLGPDYQNSALRIGESRSGAIVNYNHIIAGNGGLAILTDGFQNNHLIQNNIIEGKNSPQVVLVNGQPNVAKPSFKVDFLNNTFTGTSAPTVRDNSGTVLTQHANNSVISKNVFNTTGATYAMIDTTATVMNFNNINTATVLKVKGTPVNAENNWWGDTDPSNNVSGDVNFTPFTSSPFAEN